MTPRFPGATQCSRVSLYGDLDTGTRGGTPHLHTACTEAYVWIQGHGSVELLSSGGHEIVPMGPSSAVWFSPGVIHRGVPAAGVDDAEVLVIMQNAGLPESGDAVITLPERLWGEPAAYRDLVGVAGDDVDAARELVRERRALAMEGFAELVASVDRLGRSGLDGFYAYAREVVRPHLDEMVRLVDARVVPQVDATHAALSAMQAGNIDYLRTGSHVATSTPDDARFGMCGDLRPLPHEPHTAPRPPTD